MKKSKTLTREEYSFEMGLIRLRLVEKKARFFQNLETPLMELAGDPDHSSNSLELLLTAMACLAEDIKDVRTSLESQAQ